MSGQSDGRTVAPREHLSLHLSPLGSNNWFCDVNGGRFLAYGLPSLLPPLSDATTAVYPANKHGAEIKPGST